MYHYAPNCNDALSGFGAAGVWCFLLNTPAPPKMVNSPPTNANGPNTSAKPIPAASKASGAAVLTKSLPAVSATSLPIVLAAVSPPSSSASSASPTSGVAVLTLGASPSGSPPWGCVGLSPAHHSLWAG